MFDVFFHYIFHWISVTLEFDDTAKYIISIFIFFLFIFHAVAPMISVAVSSKH